MEKGQRGLKMDCAGRGSVFELKTKVFPEISFADGDLGRLPGSSLQKHSVMKEFGRNPKNTEG